MPVRRGSTPAARSARPYGPASRSAKRRPTLPNPTSAMRRTGRTAGIIRRTKVSLEPEPLLDLGLEPPDEAARRRFVVGGGPEGVLPLLRRELRQPLARPANVVDQDVPIEIAVSTALV